MNRLISEGFRKIKRLPMVVSLFLLTGCSGVDTNSDMYNKIKEQTQQFTNQTQASRQESAAYFTERMYEFCNDLKKCAPAVIVGSILIGVLLMHIISEDQAIRRQAILVFIVAIPLVMFLVTYGLSWLVGTFL